MSTTTTSTTALSSPVKPPAFQRVSGRRRIKDTAATVLVTLSVVVALIPLAWVLFTVVAKGLPALTSPTWFTHSLSGLTSSSMGGGIYHALVGTLLQGLVCAIISIPLGVFVAIYLVEYAGRSRLGRITTFMVDILSGVPSIVAALFIYALWVSTFGMPKSGFAVSLALVLLMVPVVVRSTEEMLRIVRRTCAKRPTPSVSPSGRPSRASCCPPRSPASSPASCSPWPASWARRRRC